MGEWFGRGWLWVMVLIMVPVTGHAGAGDVVACRALKEEAARFACYERTVEDLARDLEAQKRDHLDIFGFFRGRAASVEDLGRDAPLPDVTSMGDKLLAIGAEDGKPLFFFTNGQVWAAQDYRRVTFKGDGRDHAVVRRALIGYLIEVNDSGVEISVARRR